jgi:hypothetical protein
LKEVFFYDAIPDALEEEYDFGPGRQWSEYGTEQQASIVEAWTIGATKKTGRIFNKGTRRRFAMNLPLFRYINGNIRRGDSEARTGNSNSVRDWLREGGHQTVRQMHSEPPPLWWS